jgi:hypothetical protein
MIREAKCTCGQLTVRVVGDPTIVLACSCLKCQRRTGSVFGVSAYFPDEQVEEITGDTRTFNPPSDSGRPSERHFCPHCGTAVYWKAGAFPGHTGIAVGTFADPAFPAPMVSVWNGSKHSWVEFPEHWPSSDTQDIDPGLASS